MTDGTFGKIAAVDSNSYLVILDDGASKKVPFSFVKKLAKTEGMKPKMSHLQIKDFEPIVNHVDRKIV